MPPKANKPTTGTGSIVIATSRVDTNDEEVDSRPQTPLEAMDFSSYEFSGIFVEEIGQQDVLDNDRKSEVYTAIGYTCTGLKVVIQAWAPYDKDISNFMK